MARNLIRLLRRTSIPARTIVLAILLLLPMAATSAYLFWTLQRAAVTTAEAQRIAAMSETVSRVRSAFQDLLYWRADLSVSLLTLAESRGNEAKARVDAGVAELRAFLPTEADEIATGVARFDETAMKAVDAYTDDQRVVGNALFAEARSHGEAVENLLKGIEPRLLDQAAAARIEVLGQFTNGVWVSLAMAGLAVVLGGLLTFIVLASILPPLKQLVAAIGEITRGRTDVALPAPARDELGSMRTALSLLADSIGERDRLTEEARRQRQTLYDAIESINQGFALYDADDRLQLTNTRYRGMLEQIADTITPGVAFVDLLRKSASFRGMSDDETDRWIAERLARRGRPESHVEQFIDGRWVQIQERRTGEGGIVAVYTDVTEMRERQHELELAKEAADHATQVKSEFLANMSHELRTPLNAIIGYSQLLMQDAEDDGQTDAVADLKKIEGAGQHLLRIINDILDLSKIEAGRMEVFLEPVDIAALARDVETLVRPLAAKNRNTFVVELAEGIGSVRTDHTKLKQIVLNLLSNATKFTQDGTVTMAIARTADGSGLQVAVSDTGIGLTEAQLGRLFQAFSQADSSTTRRFGGTGLGLAISRSFARTLGGDLTVTSTAGEGSCFLLTIADGAAEADDLDDAEPDSDDAAPDGGSGKAGRVLVVDDDAHTRHIIGSHLVREGYAPLYAGSGAEALEMARLHRPDAITLDIMMPQVDGWAVLVALKEDPDLAGIPVVIVSITDDRSLAFTLGAAAMLTKPLNRTDLLATLERHLPERATVDGGQTMLIVEDDGPTRELMARVGEKLGMSTASAVNGREALAWLGSHGVPDAILLDLNMPEMDGFEFLERLRQDENWRGIPVIVVTARELSNDERSRLSETTQGVIAKGQAAHFELSRAIRAVTGSGTAAETSGTI